MSLKQLRGITVLEVIIAIIVFGIGLLVILSMLTKNVSWIRDIENKDTATMLAKEGLEIVYNLRDTNTDKGVVRNCAEFATGEADSCGRYFHDSSTGYSLFTVDWSIDSRYSISPLGLTGSNWIYYHTGHIQNTSGVTVVSGGFWYNHVASGGTQTAFRRYILFRPVPQYAAHTGHILQVESHVEYAAGGRIRDVVLEGLIGKTR